MKHLLLPLTCAAALAAPLSPALAESSTATATTNAVNAVAADRNAPSAYLTPTDAAWGMVFDPGKVRTSALAGHVMDHFDEHQRASLDDKIDGVSNILGLNLRRDLGRIVAFGQSFAAEDIGIAVDIGHAETNLEGLLLADENYQSYDYADLIIHSVKGGPEQPRVYCAVLPGSETRQGVVLLSPAKDHTERLVDAARGGAAVSDPAGLGQDEFLRLWVSRIPQDMFANNPRQSNIAGMIQSLEIVGSTGEADSTLALNLTMDSPAKARLIRQMAEGGKALVEFAAESDADAAKLADLLAYVSVKQPDDGSLVTITGRCDTAGLASVLDMLDEAGAFRELGLE